MKLGKWSVMLLVLVALILSAATGCTEARSDEEILLDRIDSIKVKIYLTLKVAVGRTGTSPEIREVGEKLKHYLSRSQGPSGSADQDLKEVMIELGQFLWQARRLGAEIFASGQDDELEMVSPLLLPDSVPPELAAALDHNAEHALLAAALTFAKLQILPHGNGPIPVAPELLLYEAWHTDADALRIPGMPPLVKLLKTQIYGTQKLCDLAAAEALSHPSPDQMDADLFFTETLVDLGRKTIELEDEDAALRLNAVISGMSHLNTATCYFRRFQTDDARVHLKSAVDLADMAGAPKHRTAYIHAYLDYHDGKYEQVEAHLQVIEAADIDEEERAQVAEIRGYFEERDDGRFAGFYDAAFFLSLGSEIAYGEFEKSGALEEVKNIPMLRDLQALGGRLGELFHESGARLQDKAEDWMEALPWQDTDEEAPAESSEDVEVSDDDLDD